MESWLSGFERTAGINCEWWARPPLISSSLPLYRNPPNIAQEDPSIASKIDFLFTVCMSHLAYTSLLSPLCREHNRDYQPLHALPLHSLTERTPLIPNSHSLTHTGTLQAMQEHVLPNLDYVATKIKEHKEVRTHVSVHACACLVHMCARM